MIRILALLTNPLTAEAVLAATSNLAAQSGPAEIVLLHPRPDIDPDFMPTEDVYTETHRHVFEAARDKLATAIAQKAEGWRASGLPALQQARGHVAQIAWQAAIAADIVILGAPHGDFEAETILTPLLFKANKPVLLVPQRAWPKLGQCIAIAWEVNAPASRAVDTLKALLLSAAPAVILLMADAEKPTDPPEDLMHLLEHAGKPAKIRHFSAVGRHIGEALLNEAQQAGADMLVMGAFSHSRLREIVFGGATIEILAELSLPVLMHH